MRAFYAEAFGVPLERVVADRHPADGSASSTRAARGEPARPRSGRSPWSRAGRRSCSRRRSAAPPADATYDDSQIDYAALHALAVEQDAVVIIRMHPFVRKPLPIPEPLRDRLIDATRTPIDVNDLLFAVDLLITDYSSIVFEYSTLGRPMLFFAYDLEEYIADRDFYVPFETFVPGRIVRTCDELLDAIRRDDYEIEKVAPSRPATSPTSTVTPPIGSSTS